MPKKTSSTGSELFIVDNSDEDWKVLRYLHDWCELSKSIDIATGYFEIGGLLALKDEWQKVDSIRILMGDECSMRTKAAFEKGLARIIQALDESIEEAKEKNDFLAGVPAIVDGIRSGKIQCRVYRKEKFHAKAYITHARLEVVGSSGLVGSSNFTFPGLTENIELNVQITGRPVNVLQCQRMLILKAGSERSSPPHFSNWAGSAERYGTFAGILSRVVPNIAGRL